MSALAGGWRAPERLTARVMQGAHVRLEPLAPGHADALHAAFVADDRVWDYLPYGPFDRVGYRDWVDWAAAQADPQFHAIVTPESGPVGVASWLRITPEHGVVEVGHLNFSPALQRTPAATEAMTLMAAAAFDAGYRRYEWKCNAANAASRRAAQRLGFSYEGAFAQHMVIKGRNRDTAWFAMLDGDWPALSAAHANWLATANFGADGRQIHSLSAMTGPLLRAVDPGR